MKKLTRSKNDRVILGVCGGLAKFLNVDSKIIRIAAIILSIISFGQVLLFYLIAAIIIPEENSTNSSKNYFKSNPSDLSKYLGFTLVIIDIFSILKLFNFRLWNIYLKLINLWPVAIIIIGIYLILKKEDNR